MKDMGTLTFPDGSQYEIVDKKCREEVEKKVPKEEGKGLSTNDYDNAAKAKVDAIPDDPKYTDTHYDDTAVVESLNQIKDDLSNKLPKSPADWGSWTAEEQAAAREKIGIRKVTQAEYDALTDTSGIYIIVEE